MSRHFWRLKDESNITFEPQNVALWWILVVAISLSDFASKTDEIFRCKKRTILVGNWWSYIFVIKV